MKTILKILFLAIAFSACSAEHGTIYRRDVILHQNGTYEIVSNWYKYAPTKANDTLFQYIVKK